MNRLKELLIIVLISCGIILVGTSAVFMLYKSETARIEHETADIERQTKLLENELKTEKLKYEKMKTQLENVRLQAFLKAYSNGNYIVEVETID